MLQQSRCRPAHPRDQDRVKSVRSRFPIASVVFLAVATLGHFAYVYITNRQSAALASEDRHPFLGTWTDEAGEDGNFITFSFVRRPAPGPIPGLELWEGRVACEKFLDGMEGEGSWGYENWKPLRLNVTVANRSRVAAVKLVDQDHLMLRFVEDLPPDRRHDVFRSPDARLLTRVRPGAEPPRADRKEAP
jgi:hypothetical protein